LKSAAKHFLVMGIAGAGPPVQFTVRAGFTVTLAVRVLADFAVIVTAVAVETAPVLIVKLTVALPNGMKTDAGTEATPLLLLDRSTVTPAGGGGLAALTVTRVVLPLTGALDFIVKDLSSIAVAEIGAGANNDVPASQNSNKERAARRTISHLAGGVTLGC